MSKREWVLGILGGLAIVAVVLIAVWSMNQTLVSAIGE
jgi:hypothetical protein